MAESGQVDSAGGVESFLRGADGEPGAQDGVLVAVAGGGVDREAEGMSRAAASPIWYTPGDPDRAGRPPAEGMYTVAELADRGIRPMTDEEIRGATVGRTVPSVNLLTGFEATLYYGADGNRSLMGLGDRPLVTPYEIRDGRRIETTLLGEHMSVALFSVDGRTLGARTTRPAASTTRHSL